MATIQELALAARQAQLDKAAADIERHRREEREETEELLRSFVGELARREITEPVEWEDKTALLTVDGLSFTYGYSDIYDCTCYGVRITCPGCGAGQLCHWSDHRRLLEELADWLAEPLCADCKRPAQEAEPIVLPAWQETALAAYREFKEAKDFSARNVAARQASALAERLKKHLGIEVQPTGNRITLDGVTFVLDPYLHIEAPCPGCHKPRLSLSLEDAADIGAFLAGDRSWTYDRAHVDCDMTRTEQTATDRLVSALRELLGLDGGRE